jgi:hypothetical protein
MSRLTEPARGERRLRHRRYRPLAGDARPAGRGHSLLREVGKPRAQGYSYFP